MSKLYLQHDYALTGRDYVETEGSGSGGVNYSTEEHVIGTWVDGSALYEKTVEFGALPNTTTKSVAHGIENLSHIAFISAIGKNASNQFASIPLVNVSGADQQVQLYIDFTNINIRTATNYSGWSECMVTIQYTKSE